MKRSRALLSCLATLLCTRPILAAQPSTQAAAAFRQTSREIEQNLLATHSLSPLDDAQRLRLRSGDLILTELSPSAQPSGALLHHWRGTAFAPGARAADFETLLRNFRAYPQTFAPQVVSTQVLAEEPNHLLASMRIRQHHVLTVVLDTTYDIRFAHGYSLSRSTRVDEIASAGTPSEHALSAADNHGFLWLQDVFWSYEERDGGLYLQLETISLTRDIPTGLAWAVRPFVESIPRESLDFTLRSATLAIRR